MRAQKLLMKIEFLVGVVSLFAYEFDIIPKSLFVTILTILFLLWLLNMEFLDHKIRLIKEYTFLMASYNKYCLNKLLEDTNPDLASKQADIDRKFRELNGVLTKILNCRYRLIWKDVTLLGSKYAELIGDVGVLCRDFNYSIDSDFISALKYSRGRCPEIKNAVSDNLLSSVNVSFNIN